MLTPVPLPIAALRAREFARLDAGGHAYLDYTGSALYPQSLVARHAALLESSVLGNPHSDSPASRASSALLAEARAAVRAFFHADDYEVVFTANASGAIRLVAEAWPWESGATLAFTADNHNSVNGLREPARRGGASVRYIGLTPDLRVDASDLARALDRVPARGGLLAFPAQSNFSGVRHSLALVAQARARGWRVLLDAAAFAATSPLDLRVVQPDFVALSFYKLFGYPTGVGALLARRDALAALRRPWFAGGTVERVTVRDPSHVLRAGAEGFEDGSVDFLALGAVTAGLAWLDGVGTARIGAHAAALAHRLDDALAALRHRRGAPVVRRYGPARDDPGAEGGAVVTFNVLDPRGRLVPPALVQAAACAARVSVRDGCFCNPGAAEAAGLGADAREPGAVRASLGVASDGRDVERLVDVVAAVARGARRSRLAISPATPRRPSPPAPRASSPAA